MMLSYAGCARCGGYLGPGEWCPCSLSETARRDAGAESCPVCSATLPKDHRTCGCGWRQDSRGSRLMTGSAARRVIERRLMPSAHRIRE
jgi:predicted amidophosphoribosyltransferase